MISKAAKPGGSARGRRIVVLKRRERQKCRLETGSTGETDIDEGTGGMRLRRFARSNAPVGLVDVTESE